MEEAPADDLRSLRFLKALVTSLMLVMIVGFIVLIGLLVTRFPGSADPSLALPDSVALPEGAVAEAFTTTAAWYAIVTEAGQILVYDRADGNLLKTIDITSND